jgi:hypothetical protein
MAGLVPAIHVLLSMRVTKDVDAQDKPGHDGSFRGKPIKNPPEQTSGGSLLSRYRSMPLTSPF